MRHLALATVLAAALMLTGCATSGLGRKSPEEQTARAVAQWRQLGYGMFIHFGLSTYTGREFEPGDVPSATYAPTALDVDQWLRTARNAGMRYAVLTAKHVGGHCLWDSKVPWRGKEFDYDVATSANKTDVVAAFVKACKKYGIEPGVYYCLLDGPHAGNLKTYKGYHALPADFFQLAKHQLAELLTRHPEIHYVWLDIPRLASPEQRAELYGYLKGLDPRCVVLYNHGTLVPKGPLTIENCQDAWPTDILNTERETIREGMGPFAPRQTYKGRTYELGFEHCDTICKNWFAVEGDGPRPVAELFQMSEKIQALGGNLLLNVPPDKSGRIPDCHVQALMALRQRIEPARR